MLAYIISHPYILAAADGQVALARVCPHPGTQCPAQLLSDTLVLRATAAVGIHRRSSWCGEKGAVHQRP